MAQMGLPAEARSTSPASRRARIIFFAAGTVLLPLVRFYVAPNRSGSISGRLVLLGRVVAAVSRLQRLRPFRGLSFVRHRLGGVTVEMVRRKDCTADLADGVIFYTHGGGFFCCGLDSHLHVVARLARQTRLPVVHVDYRQYPQARVDGSIRDCLDAYRWLLAEGADPAKVVFAGDSAGGFLAFATTLAAQQAGLAAPAGVVGISPWLELDGTARLTHENNSRDAIAVGLPGVADCVEPEDGSDPSPVNGRLDSFPPSLIVAAEPEILRCDAERMHDALTRVGRPCTLRVWPAQLHAFPALFPFLPESRAAFDLIVGFVRTCLTDQSGAQPGERAVS